MADFATRDDVGQTVVACDRTAFADPLLDPTFVDARLRGGVAVHAKVQAERIAGAMLRRLTGAHR